MKKIYCTIISKTYNHHSEKTFYMNEGWQDRIRKWAEEKKEDNKNFSADPKLVLHMHLSHKGGQFSPIPNKIIEIPYDKRN